jgi:tRNA (guanine6-N2)-methyltransferase
MTNPSAYLATVLPGLEEVAADELRAKVADASAEDTSRGKVLFRTSAGTERLLALRTIDNLYLFLGRFTQGPHRTHLADLRQAAGRIDTLAHAREVGLDVGKRASIFVNASRSGKQTYSRFEAAQSALEGLLEHNRGWHAGTATAHDLEFRLDVVGEEALLALRLSPPSFRFRGEERAFARAALRPTVAHALVWLSRPGPEDVFVDPFCGSGTIVAERGAYPCRRLFAGDLDAEAVHAARSNLPGQTVMRWDARRLPLAARSVDRLVSNLPFGHQVGSESEVGGLYQAFFAEAARVLTDDGTTVVLTDQADALTRAVEAAGLAHERAASVSLKGLHPDVWRVRRR